MMIQVDSRERKWDHIKAHFEKEGIQHFVSKLPVGDYINFDYPRLAIDRKQNLQEVCTNLCQQHERFRNELLLAQKLKVQLIFLVEHSRQIRTLSDVRHWVNPRLKESPYALSGFALYQRLYTIERKYNTEFFFCGKQDTGKRLVELLKYYGTPYLPEYKSKGVLS